MAFVGSFKWRCAGKEQVETLNVEEQLTLCNCVAATGIPTFFIFWGSKASCECLEASLSVLSPL